MILVLLLIILSFLFFKPKAACGTLFYIRNTETGQCELFVGCKLPSEIKEDLACRDILREGIDGN